MKYVLRFIAACLIVVERHLNNFLSMGFYFLWNLSLPSEKLGGWDAKQQAFKDKFFLVWFDWKYSVKGTVFKTFWDFVMDRSVEITHDYVTPEHIIRGYTANAELLRKELLENLARTCGNNRKGMEAFVRYQDKIMKMTEKELFLYDQAKHEN